MEDCEKEYGRSVSLKRQRNVEYEPSDTPDSPGRVYSKQHMVQRVLDIKDLEKIEAFTLKALEKKKNRIVFKVLKIKLKKMKQVVEQTKKLQKVTDKAKKDLKDAQDERDAASSKAAEDEIHARKEEEARIAIQIQLQDDEDSDEDSEVENEKARKRKFEREMMERDEIEANLPRGPSPVVSPSHTPISSPSRIFNSESTPVLVEKREALARKKREETKNNEKVANLGKIAVSSESSLENNNWMLKGFQSQLYDFNAIVDSKEGKDCKISKNHMADISKTFNSFSRSLGDMSVCKHIQLEFNMGKMFPYFMIKSGPSFFVYKTFHPKDGNCVSKVSWLVPTYNDRPRDNTGKNGVLIANTEKYFNHSKNIHHAFYNFLGVENHIKMSKPISYETFKMGNKVFGLESGTELSGETMKTHMMNGIVSPSKVKFSEKSEKHLRADVNFTNSTRYLYELGILMGKIHDLGCHGDAHLGNFIIYPLQGNRVEIGPIDLERGLIFNSSLTVDRVNLCKRYDFTQVIFSTSEIINHISSNYGFKNSPSSSSYNQEIYQFKSKFYDAFRRGYTYTRDEKSKTRRLGAVFEWNNQVEKMINLPLREVAKERDWVYSKFRILLSYIVNTGSPPPPSPPVSPIS